jgi:uncharacterized protein (TIGR02996 family)
VNKNKMTEHDAFLQAIIESPDDDTLRLVFADWLEEHGDAERAELIRLQCSLNSPPPESPRLAPIQERVNMHERLNLLLQPRRNDFLSPLTRVGLRFGEETRFVEEMQEECVIAHLKPVFRRGFVEEITVPGRESLQRFIRHAGALFRLTPLQHLQVTEVRGWSQSYDQGYSIGCYTPMIDSPREPDLRALVELPEMARLRTLLLRLDIGSEEARVLADSPFLTDQTRLLLYPSESSEAAWETHQWSMGLSAYGLDATPWEYRPSEEIERILRARFGDSVRWCR